MFELMNWCDVCQRESAFEPVPDRDDEYSCRVCAAAIFVGDPSEVRHLAGA